MEAKGIVQGLQTFLAALWDLLANPDLRSWYFRAVLRTFLLAAFIVILLLFLGSWFLLELIGKDWWGGMATVVWVVLVIYISGILTAAISGSLVSFVAGEKKLLLALPKADPGPKDVTPLKGASWPYLKREYTAVFLSVLISLTCWPLLLIPFLMPLGVLIFAWVLGRESIYTADRLAFQNNEANLLSLKQRPSFSYNLGVGLLPSLAALLPVVGWAALPILQVSGLKTVRLVAGSNNTRM